MTHPSAQLTGASSCRAPAPGHDTLGSGGVGRNSAGSGALFTSSKAHMSSWMRPANRPGDEGQGTRVRGRGSGDEGQGTRVRGRGSSPS